MSFENGKTVDAIMGRDMFPALAMTTTKRANNGIKRFNGEFDPGSGRTLAACLTHASRGALRCHWRTGE